MYCEPFLELLAGLGIPALFLCPRQDAYLERQEGRKVASSVKESVLLYNSETYKP